MQCLLGFLGSWGLDAFKGSFTHSCVWHLDWVPSNCGGLELGSLGISVYLCVVSPHALSNTEALGQLDFLCVDSGLLKCISQERKSGRRHVACYDLAS